MATFLISIHAPRVGSDRSKRVKAYFSYAISIHAPRVGSDAGQYDQGGVGIISIHAPRVGSDFNSSMPASARPYFYPRSPRGERPAPADKAGE